MMDAGRHPLIDIVTCAEVVGLEGKQGRFRASVLQHPRYVDEKLCVACGDCVDACPQIAPNAFEAGLGARKAIYRPFAQSVPSSYLIDRDACLNDDLLVCRRCVEACPRDAIDHDMRVRRHELDVGSVVVAAGFDEYDPRTLRHFGYGVFPDVMTALEFERLLNASGPTRGHLVRPSTGEPPRRIAFVQCVGSRGEGGRSSCSRFCCSNSLKAALLSRQHLPELEEATIYFTDLRTVPRGCEDFARRVEATQGVRLVRGRPARVADGGERLAVLVEDTRRGGQRSEPADLVVLAAAAVPSEGLLRLADALGVDLTDDGWMATGTTPSSSSRPGVYLCGGVSGPRTIPESVARASAAAALSARHLAKRRLPEDDGQQAPEPLAADGPPRVGVFVCHCGINIAGVVDVERIVAAARELPGVAHASTELFACSEGSQRAIQQAIREHGLNRVVVAACTPRTHEPVFRAACEEIGLNPYLLEMANIRDQCSWVHATEPDQATGRAVEQLGMAVRRASLLEPLVPTSAAVRPHGLVVGGGVAGLACATALARQGVPVTLVEADRGLGGRLARPGLGVVSPDGERGARVVDRLRRQLSGEGVVEVLRDTQLERVEGHVGDFEVVLRRRDGSEETRRAGALALAIGADVYDPGERFGYRRLAGVMTNQELASALSNEEAPRPAAAAFVQCVGSRGDDGHGWCSTTCCPTTVRQALALRKAGAEVVVLHRGMRTADRGLEEEYRQARAAGVLFVGYEPDAPPEILGDGAVRAVRVRDPLLRRELELPVELVVLAAGMVPREPAATVIQELLKVPRSADGFFGERHPELAPVETVVDGVFLCGAAGGPADIETAISQGLGAAAKMASLLTRTRLPLDPAISVVEASRCRACGRCVEMCTFRAPSLVEEDGVLTASIAAALCKGCGTCAAWCPTGAIRALHSTDEQLATMVEQALSGLEACPEPGRGDLP
jgi:heterodisulfide reductase subunit A